MFPSPIKLICLTLNIFLSSFCIIKNSVSEIIKLNHCRQGINIYLYLAFILHSPLTTEKYFIISGKNYYSIIMKSKKVLICSL